MPHKILWIGYALTLTELGVLPTKNSKAFTVISEISKIHVIRHNILYSI